MEPNKSIDMTQAVFFEGRRTPEIVSDGAKPKKGGAGTKAGKVVKRRQLTAKEEKQTKKKKNNWLRIRKDGKKPGDKGYLSGPSKGPDANRKKNLSQEDEDRSILERAAIALRVHGAKYTEEQRNLIRSRIREAASVSINLANDDQASDFGNNTSGAGNNNDGKKTQAGKTRAQPRAFGGRFGKKGATNGEQGMPGANPDPETFVATVNNLQIGQSVALPNNEAKVKRLGSGYQLVKMDGSLNQKVKTLKEATDWVRSTVRAQPKKGVPASNDLNPPANR